MPLEPRLSLVIIAVDDRARSLAFYQAAFGWQLAVDAPTYAELALPGGMRLGIYDRRGFGKTIGHVPRPTEGVTSTELYIHVEDLAAASERLLRAGAGTLDPARERDWGETVAYFGDLDGNVIALARHDR